jgi:8-oxo-dGTP pyrophosphatase MutT (NUDIX family)
VNADQRAAGAVDPRPAATVAILREGPDGPEVLLTHRPATMAFGPGLHVFPGGALADGDADPRLVERLVPPLGGDPAGLHGPAFVVAALREAWEESGILFASGLDAPGFPTPAQAGGAEFGELVLARDVTLRGDWLVPLSRWVTPPVVQRRYDARFFVAWLPDGAVPSFHGGEVVAHEWVAPLSALEAMADGRIELWTPTSCTLQQLAGVRSRRDVLALAPRAPATPPRVRVPDGVGGLVTAIETSAAGGIPGRPGLTWIVGDRACVIVDPGDPSDAAAAAVLAVVGDRAARVVAVLVSSPDPACAAGGEGMALRLGIPLIGPEAAARRLPATLTPIAAGSLVAGVDTAVRAVPHGDARADELGYLVEEAGLVLGGGREARAQPAVRTAWSAASASEASCRPWPRNRS